MQKILVLVIIGIMSWLLILVGQYWRADYFYAQGDYEKAIRLSPKEPLYRVAAGFPEDLETAVKMAPRNIKVLEMAAGAYSDLGEKDRKYYLKAIEIQERLTTLAPTYAKFYYSLGLNYLFVGNTTKATEALQHSLELKPNYEKAEQLIGILWQ